MQVDPKLERLQTLIEQKRTQQMGQRSANAVGQAGNPRFAEAAARVREARQLRESGANRIQGSVQSTSFMQTHTKQDAQKIVHTSVVSEVDRSLLTAKGVDRTLQLGQTGSVRIGPSHLGGNFDTYA